MTDASDAELVIAAQAGDIGALGALLQRYRAQMTAVAVGLLGNDPDTEDVVQDACIQALRHIRDVRDPAAARAWLVAIVANACRTRLRRPRLETTAPPADRAFDSVAQTVEGSAVRDWVWTAIERLPLPLRAVVLLRYFSDASSYATIAELCGVPVGTVRSRLHAARANLADQLLTTAAAAYQPETKPWQLADEVAHAMGAFSDTGDAGHLASCFAADLRFALADGVQLSGRERYAALIAADLEDGVRAQPIRLIVGAELAIIELRLVNPIDQPLHCPPRLCQIHYHDGRRVQRIASHYGSDRDASALPVPVAG